jgi:hypothetical protein
MPKVIIIILNWNGLQDTRECLESLKRIDYPNYEIIVVDNGSSDGSPEKIKNMFPYIDLIRNRENLGFGAGCNVGIKEAQRKGAKFIFLLNNDTVVECDALSKLAAALEKDENAGIAGPKIYYYGSEKIIWSAGIRQDNVFIRFLSIGQGQKDVGRYSRQKKVDEVSGCAMLIKESLIEKTGFFREDYFLYVEDMEFCLRAKRAGCEILYVPDAVIWHKVSAAAGGQDSALNIYYSRRNVLYLASQYYKYLVIPAVIKYVFRSLAFYLSGNKDRSNAVLLAITDFIKGKKGRLEKY